jgi:hypothetical protein
MNTDIKKDEKSIDYSYQSYRDYSNNLRVWFMAFGFGLPTFVLANDDLLNYLRETQYLSMLFLFLGIGIFSQVSLTMLNKKINWFCYKFLQDDEFLSQNKSKFDFYSKLSNKFWIDIWLDRITVISYLASLVIVIKGLNL